MDLSNETVLVIVGPTGIGKTDIAIEISKRISSEIVSADSRQIYRFMDIGTSKPSKETLEKYPHHFINILNPDEDYSAGQFAKEARKVIERISNRRNIPLITGGSGLYIKALLEGFFGADFRDDIIRKQLQQKLKEKGYKNLYNELEKVDPHGATQIHPNNTKRVLRNLEVYYITGKPISEFQKSQNDPANFKWIKFGLSINREQLYKRINQRVDKMLEEGLIDEVESILKKGYSPELNSLNSVGYKEAIHYLNGKISLEDCIDLIKQNTRNYAKRQIIWYRREKDIQWINMEIGNNSIVDRLLEHFDEIKMF